MNLFNIFNYFDAILKQAIVSRDETDSVFIYYAAMYKVL